MKAPARRHDPFKALADPTRRAILELLRDHPVCLAGEIAQAFPRLSRPAVSRHLRVLRQARLVKAKGIGREQRYHLDAAPLERLRREWFDRFISIHDASLAALKREVESGR